MKITFSGVKSGDNVRGIGVHTQELIDHLKKLPGVEIVTFGADVIHYTKFNPYILSLPTSKPDAKMVLTIHDLIPLIYPEQYPPGIKGTLVYWLQRYLIKNVDAIVTISETSKKDICRFLSVQPNKVHVVYLAPKNAFKRLETGNWKLEIVKRFSLPQRFVLYTGDVNYNKNIPNLVKACAIAKLPLVMAGKQASQIEKMDLNHSELAHLKSINWTGVTRLGFVEDEDLVKIYNLATVYCQPSFYEGFGLPILEAFACGTPVVAARNNCHVEIGGDAIVLTDPTSPQDMADKLTEVSENKKLRGELIKKVFERVKDFTWEMTARETLQVYEESI
jgi:glycosyltransferase involved in cell wall biosynthesis